MVMRNQFKKFRKDEQGLAAVEFAIIAPLLALFLLGTTTATQSIWANGKVNQSASVIGDLVSQETTLTDLNFGQIMDAAPVLLEPFPQSDLRVTVTASIACDKSTNPNNPDIEYFVMWSQSWTDGNVVAGPQNPGQKLDGAPEEIKIADGDYIIKTVSEYTHTPTIGQQVDASISMGETAFHQPRESDPVSYPTKESPQYQNCDDMLN